MKVRVEITQGCETPYAVIYTDEITEDVRRILDVFKSGDSPITAVNEDKVFILKPEEIYLVRVENGMGIAMIIFCTVCIRFDVMYKGTFTLENYGLTKMILGSMLVGIGFGAPSAIYLNEKFPRPLQVLIHMGTGCIIYTVVAFAVGWIPAGAGLFTCMWMLAAQLAVAFFIWLGMLKYYKTEARRMNEKIQGMKEKR